MKIFILSHTLLFNDTSPRRFHTVPVFVHTMEQATCISNDLVHFHAEEFLFS